MKNIQLEIDDFAANNYDSLCPEVKNQLNREVTSVIKKILYEARITKLRKIVDEINSDPDSVMLNPDILLDLLRIEDEESY